MKLKVVDEKLGMGLGQSYTFMQWGTAEETGCSWNVLVNQDNPACHDMEFCVIHRKLCIKTAPPNSVGSSTMIWFSQHFQPLGCTHG